MLSLRKTITSDIMIPGSYWELKVDVNGYKSLDNSELITQAIAGRKFEVIENPRISEPNENGKRLKVRLLEDGYHCWFDIQDIEAKTVSIDCWEPKLLTTKEIQSRLPKVLEWVKNASMVRNSYLWGGTVGPNFDCSGLIQTSFASQQIWLPRDAYQQENFCSNITFTEDSFAELRPGDLLFFGTKNRCSHVGLYKGNKLYWHSSGEINGRNGIGIDELQPTNKNHISSFYRSILRNIGRVESCHNGTTLP